MAHIPVDADLRVLEHRGTLRARLAACRRIRQHPHPEAARKWRTARRGREAHAQLGDRAAEREQGDGVVHAVPGGVVAAGLAQSPQLWHKPLHRASRP